MFARIILVVFLIFGLTGCATKSKKQAVQSQPVEYQKTYQQGTYNDTWASDNYETPEQKTYSNAAIELSPKQIQRALKKAGFYKGEIDGKIGSKAKEAIVKFQKARGLKADGIVGKRTSAELNQYLSR